jgi:hypothetical protein
MGNGTARRIRPAAYSIRPVDAEAFQRRTRRRMGWVAVLRAVKEQLEEQGFKWVALVRDA